MDSPRSYFAPFVSSRIEHLSYVLREKDLAKDRVEKRGKRWRSKPPFASAGRVEKSKVLTQ
jgi:hypothetical protein